MWRHPCLCFPAPVRPSIKLETYPPRTLEPPLYVCKVDVDENSEAAEKYGIEAMPTFKFVKRSQIVATITGADHMSVEAAMNQHK